MNIKDRNPILCTAHSANLLNNLRTIFFFKLAGNYNAFAKWYNNHVVSRSCSKGRSKYLVETTLCRRFSRKKMVLHSQPRQQTVLHYLRI